jgi:hypothetical protein
MKTIAEMRHLALLTPDQHNPISAWISQAVERASAVMGIDDDLLRTPFADADDFAYRWEPVDRGFQS